MVTALKSVNKTMPLKKLKQICSRNNLAKYLNNMRSFFTIYNI